MQAQTDIGKADERQHIRQPEHAQDREQHRQDLRHSHSSAQISRSANDPKAHEIQIPAGSQGLYQIRYILVLQRIDHGNEIAQKCRQSHRSRPDRRIKLQNRLRLLHREFQPPQNDQTELVNDKPLNHAEKNHGDNVNPKKIVQRKHRLYCLDHIRGAGSTSCCLGTCHHPL